MVAGIYKSDTPEFQIKRNEIYKRILKFNGIPFYELELNDPDFWDKLKSLDYFIFRWAHTDDHHQLIESILPVIENYLSIKCFPDLNTCWHFDDKIKQYYLLKSLGYPVIESYIFWNKQDALKWAENADYPVVFKLKKGAGSSNVVLINNYNEAGKIIRKMFGKGMPPDGIRHKGKIKYKSLENFLRMKLDHYFLNKIRNIDPPTWQISKNYVYFQRFLSNNSFDTRVTTIGSRAFAFRRFVRDDDFRASGSGKLDFNKDNIDERFVKLAISISKELKFQSMAYDFLLNENNEPEICEISYTYVDSAISQCAGYWDENLNWIPGQFCSQLLHLKDLLNIQNLKLPDLSDLMK